MWVDTPLQVKVHFTQSKYLPTALCDSNGSDRVIDDWSTSTPPCRPLHYFSLFPGPSIDIFLLTHCSESSCGRDGFVCTHYFPQTRSSTNEHLALGSSYFTCIHLLSCEKESVEITQTVILQHPTRLGPLHLPQFWASSLAQPLVLIKR